MKTDVTSLEGRRRRRRRWRSGQEGKTHRVLWCVLYVNGLCILECVCVCVNVRYCWVRLLFFPLLPLMSVFQSSCRAQHVLLSIRLPITERDDCNYMLSSASKIDLWFISPRCGRTCTCSYTHTSLVIICDGTQLISNSTSLCFHPGIWIGTRSSRGNRLTLSNICFRDIACFESQM